ncbi:ribonuclease T2 family protein [Salipiger bermudensis]|uniref:Ribonuclease T2 family protein n=1 Tax=Salipiger bermudensis (strain DSM 26914 / JCM 13377 / KCTC 12554 / HTCC2601) TaxID=314265 RepID=Q0FGS2_SALBH|nr:ribonuclease T2 [Salipiger bermudensis]EAU43389.1 ribonuclease T2 family protein [Salipiger bermudensis HTCC2601]
MRWLVVLLLSAGLAHAEGERAGAFDYYVLSLSWSPTWCALEGDARGSEQCEADHGWILHGLWPQYYRGYPSYCPTSARPPSRARTRDMADIMGSGGLAWHQWKKHGSCSGLSAEDYFALSREAYGRVTRPELLRRLEEPVTLPATLIEDAFLEANPGLEPDMITITCREGRIQEARLCLSATLEPVPCGRDVVRDCTLGNALLDPVR